MKILYCTTELQYSNSSAAIRNRILLSGLAEHAIVDVLELPLTSTLDRDCSDLFNQYYIVESFVSDEHSNNRDLSFKNKLMMVFKNKLRPYIPDFLFFKDAGLDEVVNFSDYDVVISSSEPKGLHRVISKSISSYDSKSFLFVQYWGDPWYDDISRPTNIITKIIEGRLISKADCLIYNSSLTLERQKKIYKKQAHKMNYVPRGLQFSCNFNSDSKFSVKSTDSFSVLYAGDYRSNYRNIQNLVDSCLKLDVNLSIAGSGDFKKGDNFNSEIIKEYGRIPSSELSILRKNVDIEIVVMNSKGGQLPGKVFDVMLSNKLVILILDGDFSYENIPCQERFIIVNNNKEEIESMLNSLLSSGYSYEYNFGLFSDYLISNLTSDIVEKFEEMLNENINH
ncbi:hypothetical protein BCU22_020255 [Vibrio cyclitrophicus]|uniref:hypothetical protein n=1 Tax=Vibrio cyclitrophicus TaxID=47951 RepID=UPI0039B10E7A